MFSTGKARQTDRIAIGSQLLCWLTRSIYYVLPFISYFNALSSTDARAEN